MKVFGVMLLVCLATTSPAAWADTEKCPPTEKWSKEKKCVELARLAKRCQLLDQWRDGNVEYNDHVEHLISACEKDKSVPQKTKEEAAAAASKCLPKAGEDGAGGSLGAQMATSCKAEKFIELLK
jgi:hypothetical protein